MKVYYNRLFPSRKMGAVKIGNLLIARKEKVYRHDNSSYYYIPAITKQLIRKAELNTKILAIGICIGMLIAICAELVMSL